MKTLIDKFRHKPQYVLLDDDRSNGSDCGVQELPQQPISRRLCTTFWLRVITDVVLLVALYALIRLAEPKLRYGRPHHAMTSSIVPDFLHEAASIPIEWSAHPEFAGYTKASDAAWGSLMPIGRGYILVDNPELYGLREGKEVPGTGAKAYAVSGFHQLHCLGVIREIVYTMETTPDLLVPSSNAAPGTTIRDHFDHCLSYIRQAIVCNADPTVESLAVKYDNNDEPKFTDDGWGTVHVCRSWDALKEFSASLAPSNRSGLGVKEYVKSFAGS